MYSNMSPAVTTLSGDIDREEGVVLAPRYSRAENEADV